MQILSQVNAQKMRGIAAHDRVKGDDFIEGVTAPSMKLPS
jgi:hypothetical protein